MQDILMGGQHSLPKRAAFVFRIECNGTEFFHRCNEGFQRVLI